MRLLLQSTLDGVAIRDLGKIKAITYLRSGTKRTATDGHRVYGRLPRLWARALRGRLRSMTVGAGMACLALLGLGPAGAGPIEADVALVVSVDVSQSVDDARYRLQMDGIAEALEDPAVISTVTNGAKGRILFAMIVWAETSQVAILWVTIGSKAEAFAVADRLRRLQRYGGEFTCLARMLRHVKETVIATLPIKASRVVVDVSGDGIDNCSTDQSTADMRDDLVKSGATINGLPIVEDPERIVGTGAYRAPGSPMQYLRPLEAREQLTLEGWYRAYVMGGEFAFILPANGYADFARAMRQKFVSEISAVVPERVFAGEPGRSNDNPAHGSAGEETPARIARR